MSCTRQGPHRRWALLAALLVAAPASLSFANETSIDSEPVAIVIEYPCDDCVSPEAVEDIVDEGVPLAEMAPSSVTDFESEPSEDIPVREDDPSDEPAPLRGTPTFTVIGAGGATVSMPAPTLSPSLALSALELDELERPIDPSSLASLGATSAVAPVIVWLRTCKRAHASVDDDHASNR